MLFRLKVAWYHDGRIFEPDVRHELPDNQVHLLPYNAEIVQAPKKQSSSDLLEEEDNISSSLSIDEGSSSSSVSEKPIKKLGGV